MTLLPAFPSLGALGLLFAGLLSPSSCVAQPPGIESLFSSPRGVSPSDRPWQIAADAQILAGPALLADNRAKAEDWHAIATLPPGALQPGREYAVEIDYRDLDLAGLTGYAYVLVRDPRYQPGGDQWRRWTGVNGKDGQVRFRFHVGSSGASLVVGLHGGGRVTLAGVRLGTEPLPAWPLADGDVSDIPEAVPAPPPPDFDIALPAPEAPREASLWDVVPKDGDGSVVTQEVLQAALDRCRTSGVTTLRLPRAAYRLSSGAALVLKGFSDFTLDGGGNRLLFSGGTGSDAAARFGLLIEDGARVAVRNLDIDWDRKQAPLASLGRLVKISPDGLDLTFDLADPDAASLDPATLHVQSIDPVDETDHAYAYGRAAHPQGAVLAERVGGARFHFRFRTPPPLEEGRLYLLRHYDYQRHALGLCGNANLTLQGVRILGFPGEGIVVWGRQHHWQLLDCQVAPEEGEDGLISTTADGLHVRESLGYMKLIDCRFLRTGDDGLNLHDNVSLGVVPQGARSLTALNAEAWRMPFAAGDPVEFRRGDYSAIGFTARVVSVRSLPGKQCQLEFDRDLPPLAADSILINRAYCSDHYLIRHCAFAYNRARGAVLRTGQGIVEDSLFRRVQTAALKLHVDIESRWAEGPGGSDIVLRRNTFDRNGQAGWFGGATLLVNAALPSGNPPAAVFRDVLIEDNVFRAPPGPAIVSLAARNLILRGNRIEPGAAGAPAEMFDPAGSAILIDPARAAAGY